MLELYLNRPEELILRDAPAPGTVKENQARIRVTHGGICGSDLRVYKGSIPYATYPLRPGHEVLGVVVEAGNEVRHKVGTRVVVEPNTFCGECDYCRRGRTNICEQKTPIGVSADGAFAQELLVEGKYLVSVPDEIPDELAILIEPLSVTVHALKKAAISPGTSVAVLGCGTEGLFSIALALFKGARVTAVDVNPRKFDVAKQLGDVRVLHPGEIGDELFDVVVEAAGVRSSIEQSMRIVRPGGEIVAIGITGEPVEYPVMKIVRSEVTIHGSIIYTLEDWADAIGYLQDPRFNIRPILSKIMPLTEYQQAFADALSGDYAKIVLRF
ncbi:zinc-dependent alcohol dehydrogenase [Geobacter argillaceus]|uniref:L-iditol 2-dehydrogenase n=1 Tax=Geobacter argillaceus TaxID=345631 RepID=A0A562V836_9BACT|nr:alcohol dehydrogenase catalytic domain-containing protein [Geobacter argillaceus]TWJ14023.1 L-iditol 2-dehydrogenase [Geobacter argillaceus]